MPSCMKTAPSITYLLVYVDDILITGNSSSHIQSLISHMHSVFALKDLGLVSYFLGIAVHHTPTGLFLSQQKYAADILLKAGLAECKPYSSSLSLKPSSFSSADDSLPFHNPSLYRSIVGALQYLTLTRLDLSIAVNMACQHMHLPTITDFAAVKRILRYLKGTLHFGLNFSPGSFDLHIFSDADWAGDPSDRRSISGFCVFLGSNLISWQAKKQPTVARSSTEAEYRALAHAAAEASWVQMLLVEMFLSSSTIPTLWCDNLSAISLASNPVFHARTKHIEIDYHFVREKVLQKQLQIRYVPSSEQIADIFTKPLTVSRFLYLQSKLLVTAAPFSLRGADEDSTQHHLPQQSNHLSQQSKQSTAATIIPDRRAHSAQE
ncbi:uncharacterized protein LOC114307280 [Camellia sinensis]|uniref:uncharacterized protein LOC114307280 n=1 Tax=Camellia sinensis TaxID=4442 RepID=UPI00103622D5|nr:uncharacterized protein LOC114307280 [Camellia sinensis]